MALTIPRSFSGSPNSIKNQAEALLAKATTLAEVNAITLAARSSSVMPNNQLVVDAKARIAKAEAAAKAKATADAAKKAQETAAAEKHAQQAKIYAEKARLTEQLTTRLGAAQTQADLDTITAEAKNKGITLDRYKITQATEDVKRIDFYDKLNQAKTVKEANAVVEAGKQNKVGFDQGRVDQYLNSLVRQDPSQGKDLPTPEQPPASNELTNKLYTALRSGGNYASVLNTAKNANEVNQIVEFAKSQGQPINAGIVDRAKSAVSQRVAINQREQQQLQDTFAQLQKTGSQAFKQLTFDQRIDPSKLDALTQEQLRFEGVNLNQPLQMADRNQLGYVDPATIARAYKNSENIGNARQQVYAEAAKLGKPSRFGEIKTSKGASLYGLLDDPVTGTPGGYYHYTGTGFQRLDDKGQPVGAVIPADTFNQQQQQAFGNYHTYAAQQKKAADAAKLAEDVKQFEANLPKPGTEKYNFLRANRYPLSGPDDTIYEIFDATKATGRPGEWVKTVKPDVFGDRQTLYVPVNQPTAPPIAKKDINAAYVKQNEIINQEAAAARAAFAAEQRAKAKGDSFGSMFADFDKLINKTIGWKTIATIAGGAIAGPWGATLANATAGAVKGESIQDIAKGAAITFAMAYGAQALTKAINESVTQGLDTGALQGTDDVLEFSNNISTLDDYAGVVDDVHGFNELPQSVIDLANATDDPIAALNAAQGIGNVDVNYLQQIGATDDLIAVAEAHNTVNGFTGGGGSFVGGDYSYIPDEFVGPPTELAQGPVAPTITGDNSIPLNDSVVYEKGGLEFNQPPSAPIEPMPGSFDRIQNYDIVSTGTSDLPPGTIIGDDVVMANGKTVSLQDYTDAINSQQPITIDGMTTTGGPTASTSQQLLSNEELYARYPNLRPVEPTPDFSNAPNIDITGVGSTGVPVEPGPITNLPAGSGGISTPGGVVPSIPTEALIAAPVVIGGAIAAGGAGGGGAAAPAVPSTPTAPAPVAPSQPVIDIPNAPPVAEVTPTPEGDIIDGVQTPANPTQPVPAPQPTPPVPELPVPPVVVPPGVVAPPPVAPPTTPTVPTTPGPTPTVPTTPGTGTGTTPGTGTTQPVQPPTQPPTQPVQPPTQPPQGPEIIDKSQPYTGDYSNESVLERYTKGLLSFDNVLGLVAAGLVLPSILGLLAGQPTVNIRRPNYGPIPPINWGAAGGLVMPGVNPGFVINPAQEPFYQTTEPGQSKYAWTQRNLITRPEDVTPTWMSPPNTPAVPFGLREMQRSYDLNQVLNQINQQPLDPNFVGYSNYPTAGYQPAVFNPAQAVQQGAAIPTGYSPVMGPIAPG